MTNILARLNKRKSGCTLDVANVNALQTHWNEMFNEEQLLGFIDLARNPDNVGNTELLKHDPRMLQILRTWVQCTKLTGEAIQQRLMELKELQDEFNELAKKNNMTSEEYLKHLTETPEENNDPIPDDVA